MNTDDGDVMISLGQVQCHVMKCFHTRGENKLNHETQFILRSRLRYRYSVMTTRGYMKSKLLGNYYVAKKLL